jgi:tRNA threonylcarbamoyladenosine biosynthesis protein TsaE
VITVDLPDLAHTEEFGDKIGKCAMPGDVLLLEGDLGAGKTTLSQFIGKGLKVPKSCFITSPTYSLLHEYPGRIPMFHFDLYRISEEEIYELGFDDYFYGEGISVIEWPDRLGDTTPQDRLQIDLKFSGEHSRKAILKSFGTRHNQLMAGIAAT